MRAVSLGSLFLATAPLVVAFVPLSQPRARDVRMDATRKAKPMSIPQKLGGYAAVAFATWQAGFGSLSLGPTGLPTVRNEQVAHAARPASSSAAGSRVNKDAESLLRWSLPMEDKNARDLQDAIEGIKEEIRLKRYSQGRSDASKARSIISSKKDALLSAVRPSGRAEAQKLLEAMTEDLNSVSQSFDIDAGRGSEQERAKLDKAYVEQERVSKALSRLEELMVPESYRVQVPEEYASLPQLQGRAVVEFVVKKADPSEKFDIDGKLLDQVKLSMVIDGYNAPVTGGNFVDLVQKGFYNNMVISRSDGFVVQFGDPEPTGEKHGYTPPGSKEERKIPLEIFVRGDDAPMYGTTTEDDARGYAGTRLPFQAYGALGMARSEFEADSASSQVFWLLFESDLTPAGKNFLDGRYTCFGYTVDGAELLSGVKEGDVITSAKVTSGLENLKKDSA